MKVFFDKECLLHNPPHEFLSGKLQHYYEAPRRLLEIRQALEENAIFHIENADRSIDAKKHALQVHSEDYVEYLETAFQLWVEGGGDPKVHMGPGSFPDDYPGSLIRRIHSSRRPSLIPSLPLTSPLPVHLEV